MSSTPVRMQPIHGRGRGRVHRRGPGPDGERGRGTPEPTLHTSIPPILIYHPIFLYPHRLTHHLPFPHLVTHMDKNFGFFGRYFAEISFFGEPRKEKCTEISFVDFSRLFPIIPDNSPTFSDFSTVFSFCYILLQKSQKIVSGGIRTHPKCLEVAHSNHQAIDYTYYI